MTKHFKLMTTIVFTLAAFTTLNAACHAEDKPDPKAASYLEHYPEAAEGQSRFVIMLPHKDRGEELNSQVELQVGKTIETDGTNKYSLGGKIDTKTVKGHGYSYYMVEKIGGVASTRMRPAPGTPRVEKFVNMTSAKIRYNSRLPIVVYVPKGTEVKYRIWTVAGKTKNAEAG